MRNNNTSLPGIELAGPTMNMVNFYWESMQQLYAEHHIFLEILFTTSWWLRYLVPSWKRASNRKIVKHMKYPFIPLLAHLTCGTLAMIRYYYLYLALGDSPVPTLLDLVLSLGFTATGVQLSGYVREGNVPVLKAAFKAMAFQQAIATFAGPGPIPRALAHCGFVTVEKKHRDVEKLGIAESEEKTGAKLE
ncbi:hypothetical protein K4K49_000777 [Colletotrichum sp. SAR 10_70]|nr:hypothetical protein K4K50_000495 [Colletotrichum sp. SAR 10_71]KAI8183335.1 hypothetical protein K4K49_000777 [Colletotrichum sp. SAR 10_70]KAI8207892.1 hypothetical protein K4K52_001876 [Colletotrichum sp. SAR 10_76]KAI8247016.1 hypothetical protein K4K53_002266 [Colletotrichum sp. SAR 10_77]